MNRTGTVVAALCTLIYGTAGASAGMIETMYGIENGFSIPEFNRLHVIDPSNGDILSSVQVTLAGRNVLNSTGLAAHPATNQLWAVLRTQSVAGGPRVNQLVTLDPLTGSATLIGDLSDNFAGIAFRSDGTLIGVTGDGASAPESLFSISTINASSNFLFALGNGDDGEAIAMHPNGLMYHASGLGDGTEFFESVDIGNATVTDIGDGSHTFEYDEAFALGYSTSLGRMFLSDIDSDLYTIDVATGETTFIGGMADQLGGDIKGIAFVVPSPSAALLILAGTIGARRRRG